MGKASVTKQIEERGYYSPLKVLEPKTNCSRCGGLLVSDAWIDILNGSEDLDITAQRCVQCGEIIDPVILRNRRLP
ncbi:MAG: hypothetical protein ABI945_04365 [Nitrospirales bacterium]